MKKNDEQKKEIMRLYTEEKLSSTEIAEQLGVKRHIVTSRIKFSSAGFRNKFDAACVKLSDEEKALRTRIPEMYASGDSLRDIARVVGLTSGAIHSILTHRGIKLRDVSSSLKQKYPEGRFGELAGHWKGGRRWQPKKRKYYKGELAANWKGGRRQIPQGYVYIYNPDHPLATKDGYVMEHRLVMEKKLGRYLTRKEIIHHKNGIKNDNREENLDLEKSLGHHVAKHFDAIAENDRLKKENISLKKILDDNNLPF